jgi:hypothetical protein
MRVAPLGVSFDIFLLKLDYTILLGRLYSHNLAVYMR